MPKIRDLLDERDRAHLKALSELSDDELEAACAPLLPPAQRDPVAEWPSEKLSELIKARPDLLDEIRRRRPGEVEQA